MKTYTDHHPITPPPELVRDWARFQNHKDPEALWRRIATLAARWGADQELAAVEDEIITQGWFENSVPRRDQLRAALEAQPEPKEAVIPDQYKGHQVHVYRAGFHAGYKHGLTQAATALAQPEPEVKRIDLNAIKQAIEERDDAVRQYHYLAQSMVYHGNSVAHWHCKAKAYGDAIGKVWNELQAAGIACDGNKSCAEGVRELAARKSPAIPPQSEPVPMPTSEDKP